ncbi:MAG: hypothetical protein WEB50_15610 [Vicinamibacterales bacterium]
MLHRLVAFALLPGALMLSPGPSSAQGSELHAARQALGFERPSELLVEFEYTGGLGARGEGADTARGTGRFLLRQPGSYRLEFFRKGPRATSHQVSQEHLGVFTRWWTRSGRTQIVEFDAAGLASARKRLQREMMVYLSALLLADVPFLSYEARRNEYVVTSALGSSAYFTLQNLQVSLFRYERARPVPILIAPGAKTVAIPERMQPASARVEDFRSVGTGRLPHVLRSTYEEGWEDITIRRYVLEGGLTETSFAVPKPRK